MGIWCKGSTRGFDPRNSRSNRGVPANENKKVKTLKYDYWLTDDGLILIEGWARDGLTEQQVAHNVGVSYSTLRSWKKQFPAILTALKKGKEVVDYEVENALLAKALAGDVTAMIFWLKNRRPDRWRDKPTEKTTENEGVQVIIDV